MKVSISECKKWSPQIYDDDDDFRPMHGMFEEDDVFPENQDSPMHDALNAPDVMVDEDPPDDSQGHYVVHKIMDHKWRNGWKFLVWWENFPMSQCTWEPTKAFVSPTGAVTAEWKRYCLEKGLESVLKRALQGQSSSRDA